MIEADRADYNRAKLDHDLIVAITSHMQQIPPQRDNPLTDHPLLPVRGQLQRA